MKNKITIDTLNNDLINVSRLSNTELGKRLTMNFDYEFKTPFGTFKNIRTAFEYLFIEGYPIKLLNKKKLTKSDIESIPPLKHTIPNYWSVIAHLFILRMDQDSETVKLLKENRKPISAYNVKSTKDSYIGDIITIQKNHKISMYVKIIEKYSTLLKIDNTPEDYKKGCEVIINSFKKDPDSFIYEGNVQNIKAK